jgi:hypothetical protein
MPETPVPLLCYHSGFRPLTTHRHLPPQHLETIKHTFINYHERKTQNEMAETQILDHRQTRRDQSRLLGDLLVLCVIVIAINHPMMLIPLVLLALAVVVVWHRFRATG